eukprot:TRINITY_DN4810_c0_g1_i4.p1 TRINITY_DN4810_c0_g1~~TRINITY_DN4810_c0_g1_i4.p1  ORF type:complete len:292 (+),score=65.17 TRINITY_DN4810_c0_g1_i4:233-1108(+)
MMLSSLVFASRRACVHHVPHAAAFYSTTATLGSRMHGKVCVVTGASSGLGLGIATKFAQEGGKVVLADINMAGAQSSAKSLRERGMHAVAAHMDITQEEHVKAGVDLAVKEFGRLDVIVSNAGIQQISPIEDFSLKDWQRMMNVHLDGAFLCTKYAMHQMKKNGGGSIIYMGSVHSKLASVLKAPYVTAKHGLEGLTRAVAKEGAQYNIRTNLICPGFVLTPLVEKQIPEQAAKLNLSNEEVIKKVMLKDTVDGEFTTVDDIAEVALTFASFGTNALTGQSLIVSHGWCME